MCWHLIHRTEIEHSRAAQVTGYREQDGSAVPTRTVDSDCFVSKMVTTKLNVIFKNYHRWLQQKIFNMIIWKWSFNITLIDIGQISAIFIIHDLINFCFTKNCVHYKCCTDLYYMLEFVFSLEHKMTEFLFCLGTNHFGSSFRVRRRAPVACAML